MTGTDRPVISTNRWRLPHPRQRWAAAAGALGAATAAGKVALPNHSCVYRGNPGAHTTSMPLTVTLRSRSGEPAGELVSLVAVLPCSGVLGAPGWVAVGGGGCRRCVPGWLCIVR